MILLHSHAMITNRIMSLSRSITMPARTCCRTNGTTVRRKLSSTAALAGNKGSFSIVFDIDGVLVRGKEAVPGAKNVLDYLSSAQEAKDISRRIPFLFITNGGGMMERDKATEISEAFFPGLPTPVRDSQVMLSHTPMKTLVPKYKDKPVLVLGSKDYANVARAYGLNHVVTVEDVLHAHPELYPFKTYHKRVDLHKDPIAAIFILHDPVDWAPEIQVICDLIEGGLLESHPERSKRPRKQIPIYASNGDLVFSSKYRVPRLAQGSFVLALEEVYKKCYGGKDLEIRRFGKPSEATYRYAERMIALESRFLGLAETLSPHQPHEQKAFPVKTVYAIGDNIASDIEGANRADGHQCNWVSILVKTGVYRDGMDHPANHVVNDVQDALHLILKLEGHQP